MNVKKAILDRTPTPKLLNTPVGNAKTPIPIRITNTDFTQTKSVKLKKEAKLNFEAKKLFIIY